MTGYSTHRLPDEVENVLVLAATTTMSPYIRWPFQITRTSGMPRSGHVEANVSNPISELYYLC